MEPRSRIRPKGPQFPPDDLSAFLFAFGDTSTPLPETIRCLDEIVTDFIIETCHAAAGCAAYAHRAKIKVDDFKFALRKDPKKLGRVSELLALDRDIRRKRRAFDVEEGMAQREGKRVKKEERQAKRGRKPKGGDKGGDGATVKSGD